MYTKMCGSRLTLTRLQKIPNRVNSFMLLGLILISSISLAYALSDAETWNSKGNALFNLGKYAEAIKAYDQAIKLNPNDADVWYNKGIALEKLGKYEEANKCFVKAKELG